LVFGSGLVIKKLCEWSNLSWSFQLVNCKAAQFNYCLVKNEPRFIASILMCFLYAAAAFLAFCKECNLGNWDKLFNVKPLKVKNSSNFAAKLRHIPRVRKTLWLFFFLSRSIELFLNSL
jgi:hypothetical protein